MSSKSYPQKLVIAVGFVLSVLMNSAPAGPQRPLMVQGELIVKYNTGIAETKIKSLVARNALTRIQYFKNIQAIHYKTPGIVDTLALIRVLRGLPEVEYAEPNYYRFLNVIPNDTLFFQQYGLDNQGQTGGTVDADIDAPEAWDIATGSKNVVVADIDSGIDPTHADLVGNLYINPGEIAGNGVDDDGNGFVDDVSGWDFVDNDNNPADTNPACSSHGIHTAGTLGAVGNNGIGVSGVAQTVSIMPLRAFRPILSFCSASDADIIAAINYAEMMRVDISNNSYGGGPPSLAMLKTIAGARHLFVAAAGNEGRNNDATPAYPASYNLSHIMSIAATDDDDRLASFSNFGNQSVDIAAPGVNIISTIADSNYGNLSGTSMATPHVAGAAAVLLSADPSLTPLELKFRLMKGSDAKGLRVAAGGRLNLFNSLTLTPSPVAITINTTGPTNISPGDPFAIDVSIINNSAIAQQFFATLSVWGPAGETPAAPIPVSLAPGQSVANTITGTMPPNLDTGSYRFIGRVLHGGGDFFDEDQIIYDIN